MRKKVMFVIPSLSRGGAERVVSRLSKMFNEDMETILVSFSSHNQAYPFFGRSINLNYDLKNTMSQIISIFKGPLDLARIVKEENPDVIFSFMEPANFPTIIAGILSGKRDRIWVSVRVDPDRLSPLRKVLIRFFYLIPRGVVAVSGVARSKLIKDYWVPLRKCVAIPNGIDVDESMLSSKHPIELPFAHGSYFVGIGRLVPQKGFDLLIEAFSCFAAENEGGNLLIIGSGPEKQKIEAMIKARNLEKRAILSDEVSNPFPFLANALAFVLSSRFEGWPNVLMEALSVSCPVISFDCDTGPREVIENEVNGLLIPSESIQDLYQAMCRIYSDHTLRVKLIDGARNRISEYSMETIYQKWRNLFV